MTQTAAYEVGAEPQPVRAGYRPDVEGLRAVAVVLVMLSHAGLSRVEGGYVGVDVFFVISGFLITGMLARELRSSGRLRLRRFYARRARRLLPASAVVLVTSALLTWAFLPKNRWIDTGYDIMASALYGINWRLAAESVDYLNADAAPSIVQHFWSLAVEEQFYILWPCLLIGAAALARWRGHRNPTGAFLLALTLVGVPSLAWSVYYTLENPARAYFVSTTRLWELALGAALTIVVMNGRSLPRWLAFLTGWTGLAAIVAAGVLFTTEFAFPGYWALVPTVGAALVIASGMSPEGRGRFFVGGLLSSRPLVTIGGLSYSLYLCHWPVVVVATAVLGDLNVVEGLAAVTLSCIPAYLLHHHVENPIRFSRTWLVRSSQMLRAAALLTVISLGAAMAVQLAGWPPPPRFVPPAISKLSQGGDAEIGGGSASGSKPHTAKPDPKSNPNAVLGAAVLADEPLGDQNGAPKDTVPTVVPTPDSAANDYFPCTQSQESSEIRTCTHGKKGSETKIVVVGDSHANQWVPALAEIAQARGWELIEYTKAACSFADVLVTTKEGQPYPSCQQWGAAVMERLLTVDKPKVVITSEIKKRVWLDGRAVYTDGGLEALVGGLKRYWEKLTAAGIPVVALQDTPQPQVNIPECVQTNPQALTKCSADRSVMIPGDHGAELVAAAEGMKDVRLVDMNDAVCPTDKCAPVIGNVLVYRDTSHVSGTYARTLGPRLEERIFGAPADGQPKSAHPGAGPDPVAANPDPVAAKPNPAAANPKAILGAAVLADKPRGDQNGAPKDTYPTIQPAAEVAVDDYTDCVQAIERSDVRSCTYGARESSTIVAVVGDSHANQWVAGLSEVAEARGWTLREYTKAACSFSDVMMSTKEGQPYTSCQEWNKAVLDRLLTTEKPTFVINAQLKKGTFVDGQLRYDTVGRLALAAGLRRSYEALTRAGIPVIALQDSPTPGIDIPECVQSHPDKLTACATDRAAVLPADHGLEQVEAAKGLPDVRVIDVNDAICPTDRCAPVIGNVLVYRDTSHLTGTYVRTLVPRLDAAIGQVSR